MSGSTFQAKLNNPDPSDLPKICASLRLGDLLAGAVAGAAAGGSVRQVREPALAVAGAAATPTFTVLQLLYAKTVATGAPAVKAAQINGAAPGAGQAAPNSAGNSIVFNAETTGTGTADVVYLTTDPPKDINGNAAAKITDAMNGVWGGLP